MPKILILTAAFGEGYNAAARNVRDALELISDDVQVEVVDLLETAYGSLSTWTKRAYMGLVQHAPSVWVNLYSLIDYSFSSSRAPVGLSRLKQALGDLLYELQPDCVVSTYPVYGHIVRELYPDAEARPFRLVTIVTDSISVNSIWHRAGSDLFGVANEETAAVMRDAGVSPSKLRVVGFPVSHLFAETMATLRRVPAPGEPRRILCVVGQNKKKVEKMVERLLEIPDVHLTVTVGHDLDLKKKLVEQTAANSDRVQVLGWTTQMPHLMLTHHLMISEAGGATIQEAIAGRCPMIINHVVPGQQEGNAELVRKTGVGAVVEKNKEVSAIVEEAFSHCGQLWEKWRSNLQRISKPDASFRAADLILSEAAHKPAAARRPSRLLPIAKRVRNCVPRASGPPNQLLLCDFHIHTGYSDGKLGVAEVVDFYGERGFDCIAITDHLVDPRRWMGKMAGLAESTLKPSGLEEYFEVLERERRRAWDKYSMVVMTGFEFNKGGEASNSSANFLAIDLKAPIPAALDIPETIMQAHVQGALVIASHPRLTKSEWGKDTLYLWHNQERFAALIDAWEIANRNHMHTPSGMGNVPFVANSDFHKPKHIYSWKTLLHCEKEPEAIKACLRSSQNVAITLYRDVNTARRIHQRVEEMDPSSSLIYAPVELPMPAAQRSALTRTR